MASQGESRCEGLDSWLVQLVSLIDPSGFLYGVNGFTTLVASSTASTLAFFAGLSTLFSRLIDSQRLVWPPVLSPLAPSTQPPFSVRPSCPKSKLPAPTVSDTRSPPPAPETNCSLNFNDRESRHDMLPPSLFSARWWPVAEELKGSNIAFDGFAAFGAEVGAFDEGMLVSKMRSLEAPNATIPVCVAASKQTRSTTSRDVSDAGRHARSRDGNFPDFEHMDINLKTQDSHTNNIIFSGIAEYSLLKTYLGPMTLALIVN